MVVSAQDGKRSLRYQTVRDYLLARIEAGEWGIGAQIPPELALSSALSVSRSTVRQAISDLIRSGHLCSMQGRGTFVVQRESGLELPRIASLTEDLRARGQEPKTIVISAEIVHASEDLARHLGLRERDEVAKVHRLRLADGEPLCLSVSWFPLRLVPGLLQHDLTSSLFRLLEERYGLRLHRATQTVHARQADEYEAKLLDIAAGAPVLVMERTAYTDQNRPVERLYGVFRSDRYHVTMEVSRRIGEGYPSISVDALEHPQ